MKHFVCKPLTLASALASALATQRRPALGLTLVAACVVGPAWANPTGANVVRGAALASNPTANVLQIVNTPGTIINWQGFSIANGETTRFVQLNGTSAVLNRVVGGNPSNILGRMESNGRVFLINPNGIVFGGGSVVDTAGLIASTRNITDANFAAGNYSFSGTGPGTITLQSGAVITTANYAAAGGGQVWLIAKDVTLSAGSTITAPSGQVVMAAGTQVEVGTTNVGQMSFTVLTDGNSTVNSLGLIAADRGAVGMFADFINHRGTINAGNRGSVAMNATKELRLQGSSHVNAPDGNITLRGGSLLEVDHAATINADGVDGKISFESNNLLVAPGDNIHAVGGNVTFRQYGPSQYTPGATQQAWVIPANHSETDFIVYRTGSGDYVLRFSRFGPSGDAVGLFEVTLDGRTGALLAGPTAIVAGSAEATAYNAARATYRNGSPAAPTLQTTLNNAENAAWDSYNAAYQPALAVVLKAEADWRAAPVTFNATTGKLAVDQYHAILAESSRQVPYTELGYAQGSGSLPGDRVFPGGYANSDVEKDRLFESARALSDRTTIEFNAYVAPFKQAYDDASLAFGILKQQLIDTRVAAINAASSSYGAAYNTFRDATRATLRASEAAYYSAISAGIPAFYSNADQSFNGLASTVRANDGSLLGEHPGGRESGIFLADGSYLIGATSQDVTVRALNDSLLLTLPAAPYQTRFVPNSLGGFSQLSPDYANNQNLLLAYTKAVVPYTPVNSTTGSTGLASSFALRAGVANDPGASGVGAGVGGTPPAPPVVSGRASGGATFDESLNTCNAALCPNQLRESIEAINAGRTRANDIGNMTAKEFIDSLIAADKAGKGGEIDDQSAAVAVQELARNAGRRAVSVDGALSVGTLMTNNGELRKLVLGYGDLGSMSPQARFLVLQRWMSDSLTNDQLVGGERASQEISIRNLVSNITTLDEFNLFMDAVVSNASALIK